MAGFIPGQRVRVRQNAEDRAALDVRGRSGRIKGLFGGNAMYEVVLDRDPIFPQTTKMLPEVALEAI
ncbi:MAG: hypothetical protein NTZ05_14745 [Chloroflexi bacterium]|nr:hypothetical protein [Chloroflexota bacterium]